MKQLITIACVATLCAVGAHAQSIIPNLDEGTKQISGSGSLDTDHPLGTEFQLQLGYGYFIADNLELIVLGGIRDNDEFTLYEIGGAVEYNFPTDVFDGRLVPHIGVAGLWAGGEVDDGPDNDTAVGRVFVGPKFFIDENVALALEATFSFAADDIYVDEDGDAEDTNFTTLFSIRFYFD